MFRLYATLRCVFAALVCVTCAGNGYSDIAIPKEEFQDDFHPSLRWLAFGPFYDRVNAQERDFLEKYGESETRLTNEGVMRIIGKIQNEKAELTGHPLEASIQVSGEASLNFLDIFKTQANKGTPSSSVYLVTQISSERARKAFLLCGSDDGIDIWLNGQKVHHFWSKQGRQLTLYDDLIELDLRKGLNLLVAKVSNIEGGWAFGASILPTANEAISSLLDHKPFFLRDCFLKKGDPIQIDIARAQGSAFQIAISTSNGAKIAGGELTVGAEGYKAADDGLYQAEIVIAGRKHVETFCVGDPAVLGSELADRAYKRSQNETNRLTIAGYLHRIKIVTAPENKSPRDRKWQRKVLYLLKSLERLATALERGADPIRGQSGLHLIGFRSEIDGQAQYFRLSVPEGYNGTSPLPLIVIPPTAVEVPRPFLDSPFIADQASADRLGEVAGKHGCAVLWVGYRNLPYGNLIEFAHFEEVMLAVKQNFAIDPQRVFLLGSCSSGMTSAMMAVRWPKRFAAIAMVNPVLHRTQNSWFDDGRYTQEPGYRAWLQHTDPVPKFAALTGLKVWIVQTGDDPAHGPKWHSKSLQMAVTTAHRGGEGLDLKVDWEIGQNYQADVEIWAERFIPWFGKLKRVDASDYQSGDTGTGPIANAFTEKFLLVEPTMGSIEERKAGARLSNSIESLWEQTFFGSCRSIKDYELTTEQERDFNLVLIGNDQSNSVWSRMENTLPVRLENEQVKLGSRTWSGRALGIQAVIPSPVYPGRTIVLVGGQQIEKVRLPKINFFLEGWYSYHLWSNELGDGEKRVFGNWRETLIRSNVDSQHW